MPRISSPLEATARYIIQEVARVENAYLLCDEKMTIQQKLDDAVSRLKQIRGLLERDLTMIRMSQRPVGRHAPKTWISPET